MIFDNFNTARCKKCGWIKQFAPGKEYTATDFVCNCKEIVENKQEVSRRDQLMNYLKGKGVKVPHNIGDTNLERKVKEVQNGEQG
jgi:hypothetical protein